MNEIIALIITLVSGLTLGFSCIVLFKFEKNKHLLNFVLTLEFTIIIFLLFNELIPEALKYIGKYKIEPFHYIVILAFALAGFYFIKILDKIIPHHYIHNHEDFFHIGVMSAIALISHNIIEGLHIYDKTLDNIYEGITFGLQVSLVNIAIGVVIALALNEKYKDHKKTTIITTIVGCSTIIGSLILFISKSILTTYNSGLLISVTIGMLVYILLFELTPRLREEKDIKTKIYGILTGVIITIFTIFL